MDSIIRIITLIVMAADLAFCTVTGIKSRKGVDNADDYFIAGKGVNSVLLALSAYSGIMGAGLFVGHCGRGAVSGISAYWLLLGEGVVAGIIFTLFLGPFLARFKYYSMAHFIGNYICGGNILIRRISGAANLITNLAWAGAQIMGIAYVVQSLTGIDSRIVAIICGAVFIFYTMSGGIKTLLITDTLHGIMTIITCVVLILFSLKLVGFNIGTLREAVLASDAKTGASMWSLTGDMTIPQVISAFFTGFLGTLSNPVLWNRSFASKDAASCRKAFSFTFIMTSVLPFFAILIGIITYTFNTSAGDYALVWLVSNKMPGIVTLLLAISVMSATLSTADTHLNCAAANIVTDMADPLGRLSAEKTLFISRIATVICGLLALIMALTFPGIYDLGNFGYAVCGGVLFPLFVIGLVMKKKNGNCGLSPAAAISGLIAGICEACLFQFVPALYIIFDGGTIPAAAATIIVTLIVNAALSKR